MGWVIFAVLLIAATTNAVNLTDGLDGLAAGSSICAFITMTVVAFWAFRHESVYEINHALDLAVIAAAMVGGITGFLWWNAPRRSSWATPRPRHRRGPGHPRAHAQRAAAAHRGGAVRVRDPVGHRAGGQLPAVRATGAAHGARHHHFELGGWPETTVIIRFWILAIMSMAVALGLFYADSISAGVLD